MPKRIPTPPPGDDEPKYLTIWFPYPAHPNLDDKDHRRALAYWVAKMMRSPDDLFAILYRKVSANMVVIEINRHYKGFHNLLGSHKWSEFISKPSKEEEGRESKIYWCTFRTGREAEKHGYKRAMVEDTWFKNTGPYAKFYRDQNAKFVDEIPLPSWCDLPDTEVKDRNLCRPIPLDIPKAIAPLERAPPVGSQAWVDKKPLLNAKGKKSKAERKLQATNAQIEALYAKIESTSINAKPSTKKENAPPIWVAPHPKSGVKGNLLEIEKQNVQVQVPAPAPGLSWADCSPSLGISPIFSPSDPSELAFPNSPFSPEEPLDNQESTVNQLNITDPDFSPTSDSDSDCWEVRAEAVTVIESKKVTEALQEEGALMPSYSWDAEEDPTSQPPLCPHHRAACGRHVCLDYQKILRDWELMQEDKVEKSQTQTSETFWDSENDDDFTRVSSTKDKRSSRGHSRGGRGGRGKFRATY